MFKNLRYDIRAIKSRDPAARSSIEVLLLYSGLHALLWYRIAHWFYRHHCFFLARFFSQSGRLWTGIEIHPGAQIGRGFLSTTAAASSLERRRLSAITVRCIRA